LVPFAFLLVVIGWHALSTAQVGLYARSGDRVGLGGGLGGGLVGGLGVGFGRGLST
jgi:hypothetical protein